MSGFETRPVKELPQSLRGVRTGLSSAFAELPRDLAIFVPRRRARLYPTAYGILAKRFPDRVIHSRIDRLKDGVWYWWEPRGEGGVR